MQTYAPSSHSSLHIGIAGAGLLGRLTAWRLLLAGHRVSLFDAGSMDVGAGQTPAAAFTAAGMVAPLSEAVVSERAIYDMGLAALELWPEWLAQLPANCPRFYHARGSLVVAHAQDSGELWQFERDLEHRHCDPSSYNAVDSREIEQLEPALGGRFNRGLLLKSEAHIDNRQLLRQLLLEIERLGGELHRHTPVEVEAGALKTEAGRHRFDKIVDCRGMGAKTSTNDLRGVRGEVLSVQSSEITLLRPVRLMHPRYQLYVVPKPGNIFVIGATSIESEDLSPVSLQSNLELSSALYSLNPAFAEARIIDMSANLRPAYFDNNPRIEIEGDNLSANGLYRHGWLLAPAVVEQLLRSITGANSGPFANFLISPTQSKARYG